MSLHTLALETPYVASNSLQSCFLRIYVSLSYLRAGLDLYYVVFVVHPFSYFLTKLLLTHPFNVLYLYILPSKVFVYSIHWYAASQIFKFWDLFYYLAIYYCFCSFLFTHFYCHYFVFIVYIFMLYIINYAEARLNIFKNSVRTAKKTPHFTITKINQLALFKEIIAVYTEHHTRPTNTKCTVAGC
jgi:hypothetical protein